LAKKKIAEKPPRVMTRRQKSLHQRQQRRQRIIFISGVSIIAAIILIVLVGWFLGEYRPMNENIIKVNDEEFNTEFLIDYVKIGYAESQPGQNVAQLIDSALNNIIENELVRQAAATLGITVADEDIKMWLETNGYAENDASKSIAETRLLEGRLLNEFFKPVVPVSDNQVYMKAMMVESEGVAVDVRNQLVDGAEFTELAPEYGLDYYSKNINSGDYGWHPRVILKDRVSTAVPLDFAFSAEIGTLSQPLYDEEISKQFGYWLINVLEKPDVAQVNANAILLTSRELADDIRSRLVAGDNLTAIALEYSDYSLSKEKGGELGLLVREQGEEGSWKTRVSSDFDAYVFSDNVSLGEWSEPVPENTLWTEGGYWLVEVVDREEDREISMEDRNILIERVYSDWVTDLRARSAAFVGAPGLTDEIRQMVIEEVLKG